MPDRGGSDSLHMSEGQILQRPLHAWELAALQGIGEEEFLFFGIQSVPPNLIQDLAGNSFSGNICTAVLLSTLVAWRR